MEKQRWEELERRREEARRKKIREEKRREEERRSEKRKSPKKEDAGARKGGNVAIHLFFQWFVVPEGRKVGSLKRRVRSHLGRWEMNNCTLLWREAYFEVKSCKKHQVRHNYSDQFWKLRWWKSARCCGEKHITKLKCTKHTMLGALLEGDDEKFTVLWLKAHYEVKMYKTHHGRITFGSWDDEQVHSVVTRSTFRSQVLKTDWFWALLEVEMLKACTRLWREAHLEVKMLEAPNVWTAFGRSTAPRSTTTKHYSYNCNYH